MSNRYQQSIIQDTLPRWFIDTTPPLREALQLDMSASQRARIELQKTYARIQDLPTFARPLLTKALDAEFGEGLDVDNDYFYHVRFERDWLTGRAWPKGSATFSLLEAALQNFEAQEAQDAARESTSAIYRNRPDAAARESGSSFEHPLKVSAQRFIELCRRLDLGQRYQTHLRHVLHPVARPDVPGSAGSDAIKACIIDSERLALRVESHIARAKGLISEAQYQALLATGVQGPASGVFTLQLLGQQLRGALLFQRSGQPGCVVYLPGEPEAPVMSYASVEQFTQVLREKLRDEGYQGYFQRFVAQRSSSVFFPRLHQRLAPDRLHSVARGAGFHRQLISVSEVDANADLDLQTTPVGGSLGDCFYLQQMLRIKDDARVLAVPTDDEDQISRQRRLAAWLDYGMDALNVAALFVPGLGETLMVMAGAQLLTQTFEGIHAWQHGDLDQALGYLGGVAENLAFVATLGAVGAAAGGLESAERQASSFIDRMVPVKGADGRVRLTDTVTAFRRLHPSLAEFDDKTIPRIMAVSDVDQDYLGQLHLYDQPPTAALSDTAKRFRLSQQAAHSSEAFEAAYTASEQSADPLVLLLRRDFPSLTLASAQELIAQASAEQTLAMQSTRRIPLEVAGKVRAQLRQTRRSRVLEGFFLTSSRTSADLQRLTLHSVATFAGWPADLCIEIRDGALAGPLLDSIGVQQAATRRVLVRGEKAYCAQDSDGKTLGREGSLFSALLSVLGPERRAAMGLADPDLDARVLKRRIFSWIKAQPKWVARTLGEWTLNADFKAPMRSPDGHIGYPLSGRGPALPPPDSALQQALLQALTELYPESIELPEQVRSMVRRGRPLAQLLAATQARAQAWVQLHASLLAWADDVSVLLSEGERLARRRTAEALGQAWRFSHDAAPRGSRYLTLEYIALPELPALPNFYADITHLELVHLMPDAARTNAFLANFPGLTHLNIRGSFSEMPSVLPQLQQLEHLALENMPWTVDQAALDTLMEIPALDSLSLAGTPLGVFTDTSGLRLSTLWINNTGLTEWPQWAHNLGLDELDISDNQIHEIPEEVIENPLDADRHLVIYAYNNPFGHQALEDYWRNDTGYGHRYQLDYDFPEDIREIAVGDAQMGSESEASGDDDESQAHGHRAGPSNRAPVAQAQLWLRTGEDALNQRLLAAWARVEQAADAPHLLTLLQRLRQTADFRLFHAELASDVLTVLEAVGQDVPLRGQVEVMANDRLFGADQTCQDGARLIFSDIQVAVYSHQALPGAAPTQQAEALLGVIRQLFRLNQVQAIADAEIARRESLGMPVDHAEVRLAYRIGLADDLGLPGQPQRMTWVRLAAVDRGTLLAARRRVLEAERSPAFLQFAVSDRQWNARLRAEHASGLEAASATVREQMAALEDNPPSDPDQYHRQGLALIAQRDAAENQMLSQLTDLYRAGW